MCYLPVFDAHEVTNDPPKMQKSFPLFVRGSVDPHHFASTQRNPHKTELGYRHVFLGYSVHPRRTASIARRIVPTSHLPNGPPQPKIINWKGFLRKY